MEMPSRYVSLDFSIDTNRINAMQKCEAMNLLETWHQNNVIQIDMCDIAQTEVAKGSAARFGKASNYIYPITLDSHRTSREFTEIKKILFPTKQALTSNEENDVIVILHAKLNHSILVTNDGDSKRQPNGILGNKDRLFKDLGVKVMRDTDAVALVEQKIIERDVRARRVAKRTGEPIQEWVGKDCHNKKKT